MRKEKLSGLGSGDCENYLPVRDGRQKCFGVEMKLSFPPLLNGCESGNETRDYNTVFYLDKR